MLSKKYRSFLISLAIIAAYISIIFLLFYGNNNGLGKSFGVAVIYIITRNVVLVVGGIVLLSRIFKLIKSNTHLIYILIGTVNLSVGILSIVLYFLQQADMQWLNKCLLNLLLGFLIVSDTIFLGTQTKTETEF